MDKAGQVIGSPSVVRVERAREPSVWAGSGAALGFLLALVVAWFRPASGWVAVLRRKRAIPRVRDVPSLGPR